MSVGSIIAQSNFTRSIVKLKLDSLSDLYGPMSVALALDVLSKRVETIPRSTFVNTLNVNGISIRNREDTTYIKSQRHGVDFSFQDDYFNSGLFYMFEDIAGKIPDCFPVKWINVGHWHHFLVSQGIQLIGERERNSSAFKKIQLFLVGMRKNNTFGSLSIAWRVMIRTQNMMRLQQILGLQIQNHRNVVLYNKVNSRRRNGNGNQRGQEARVSDFNTVLQPIVTNLMGMDIKTFAVEIMYMSRKQVEDFLRACLIEVPTIKNWVPGKLFREFMTVSSKGDIVTFLEELRVYVEVKHDGLTQGMTQLKTRIPLPVLESERMEFAQLCMKYYAAANVTNLRNNWRGLIM
jgi:hypothetical protein